MRKLRCVGFRKIYILRRLQSEDQDVAESRVCREKTAMFMRQVRKEHRRESILP